MKGPSPSASISGIRQRKTFRKAAVVLLIVAATFGGLALLGQKLTRRERDWYGILDQLAAIETRLQAGDSDVSQRFENGHGGGARLTQDMQRLARVEDLRLQGVHVEVRGDMAEATYRLRGNPPTGSKPPPAGGRFAFRRTGESWSLDGHTFTATAPSVSADGTGDDRWRAARAHRHLYSHERLVTRLAAITGLALIASLSYAVWPWLEAGLGSRPSKRPSSARKRRAR